MSLLRPTRDAAAPHLERLAPRAALPGGCFEVSGANLLLGGGARPQVPLAFIGSVQATIDMVRPSRAIVRIPEGAIAADLSFRSADRQQTSNALQANVGVPMAEDLHLVGNPCVDPDGSIYAMVSGPRGQRVPVSIFRIDRDLQMRPFARDLMNISGLAFGPDNHLYASSRSDGVVYRISVDGAITTFAEGLGLATGIAFDPSGNLCVGDRSGTIFKVSPDKEIFVFATLEPSVAAYHLAFDSRGTLFVAAPSTSSHQSLHGIDTDGNARTIVSGLGRPQGMAFDVDDTLYIAASFRGQRGIFSIDRDETIEHVVSGNDLIGLCFLADGCAAIASNSTLFHIDLGIQGRPLV